MKVQQISPVFVEFIPDYLEDGCLYISEQYSTAIHKCCCGCGEEVVTPFSPVDWRFVKGVGGVSLYPSIGNWSYHCKSHYFIRNNRVLWAKQMSQQLIQKVQQRDFQDKQQYIAYLNSDQRGGSSSPVQKPFNGFGFIGLMKEIWRLVKSAFGYS